ncbi:MAG: hypothetical protein Q8Q09_08455 [Deltaproteobacteria bacterium]|nr:hypothetical protein [Deltaproteobacteria bacterium]
MNVRLSLISLSVMSATAAVALWPHGSEAVQTRTVSVDSATEFTAGTLDRTAVTSDGSVVLGRDATRIALDPSANGVWALLDTGTAVFAGTASDGRVYRITHGRAEHWANTSRDAVAVTALAQGDGATIFAATLGHGKVLRLRAPEAATGNAAPTPRDAEVFAELPGVEHIWALVYDSTRRVLLAATGPDGKLFAIDAQGRATLLFDADEPNLYALALGPNGSVYAGTSGAAAVLYHVRGPSDARAIARLVGGEVKDIVLGDNGTVYVTSNTFSDATDGSRRSVAQSRTPAPGGTSAARPRPGRGSLYSVRADGVAERIYVSNDTHFTALAYDGARHEVLVGHAVHGQVVAVEANRTFRTVFDADESTILAIALRGESLSLGTSDTGAVYSMGRNAPARASWTSRTLDATNPARWGAVRWRGTGSLDWEIRSGNSDPPDSTWSSWAALREDGTVGDTVARYLQIRARWSRDPSSTLRAVTAYYLPSNQRPVLTELTTEARTSESRPQLRINWKVENPDGDALRYRLHYRGDGETGWRTLMRNSEYTTSTNHDWSIEGLPEGHYRVAVEASDEAANPEGESLSDRRESEPVLVDHTPPAVTVQVASGRVSGTARDGASAVTRVEWAVDTLEWRPMRSSDGLFDEREERFESPLSAGLSAGEHTVSVRATDEAGNVGTASTTVRIAATTPTPAAGRGR